MYRFNRKSTLTLALACTLLMCGLAAHMVSDQVLSQVNDQTRQFERLKRDLRSTRAEVERYQAALGRMPWPAGTKLKQEPLTINSRFDRKALGQLAELLAQTHDSKGIFAVKSFELNLYRDDKSGRELIDLRLSGERSFAGRAQ